MRWLIKKSITSGPSFCHVSRKIAGAVGIPCRTSGTQKWNGTSPTLINRARVSTIIEVKSVNSAIW